MLAKAVEGRISAALLYLFYREMTTSEVASKQQKTGNPTKEVPSVGQPTLVTQEVKI